MKRHKSTIHREIKRNFWADDAFPEKYAGYFGHAARLQTQKRRSVQRKLIRHPDLCKSVVARIRLGPSRRLLRNRLPGNGTPEQIGTHCCPPRLSRSNPVRSSAG